MSEEILDQLAADMNKLLTEPVGQPQGQDHRSDAARRPAM